MDGNPDMNPTSLPANRKGGKLAFNLIDIIENILSANNDINKKTVEVGILNSEIIEAVSAQNPLYCTETPKRPKRRRENEPTALEYEAMDPGCASSDSSDPTWEKNFVKKPRKTCSETERKTFPQGKKFTSAPPNDEEANETTRTKVTTQLRANLKKRIPKGEKPFKCGHCDYRTHRSTYLQEHERTHTGEKPHQCGYCDYRASQISTLRQHERTHTGEKPYKCGYCDYRASQSGHLRRHKSTHTGEKPHKCGYCDYRASQIGNLRQHEKTHTGEKPYICSHCDYRANERQVMRLHERTHTGEKPFECDQCNYRTTWRNDLRRHERTHTGVKPYKCVQCDYRASVSSNLRKHERTHAEERQPK